MNIELVSVAKESDLAAIAEGLGQHALASGIEPRNAQAICILLRGDQNRVVGGLKGNTVWGWLHVSELWIAENIRGSGFGTQLMRAAEIEARRRGCHHALLDTFDFQARPFYEKLGYKVFGELANFPRGHTRFFMSKAL
jgi:GNAT superfamily N-acetyltransferase